MHTTKTRFLTPFYLSSLCVTLPLLWLTSPDFRGVATKVAGCSTKRKWQLCRVLARYGAESLGMLLPLCMLLPALGTGLVYGYAASALGAVVGFLMVSLVPILMPVPSCSQQNGMR